MDDSIKRTAALARLATLPVAAAAVTTDQHAADAAELDTLLTALNARDGVVSAAAVRRSGMPKVTLMNRLRPWAKRFSDPPISHFHVGAIVEGASGALYAGANFEFPGQTLAFTVHGEGAATTNAWLHGERGIVSVAVGGVPCGYCRQFLAEFVPPENFTIWMPDDSGLSLASQLPNAFLPAVLGVKTPPFADRHALELSVPSDDPVLLAALHAAARSHAPYSRTYAGVALQLHDGAIIAGRSAENVAFNPGMPPLEAALIALRLRGRTYGDIARAALVETAGRASMHAATAAVLRAIAPAPLTYAQARPAA